MTTKVLYCLNINICSSGALAKITIALSQGKAAVSTYPMKKSKKTNIFILIKMFISISLLHQTIWTLSCFYVPFLWNHNDACMQERCKLEMSCGFDNVGQCEVSTFDLTVLHPFVIRTKPADAPCCPPESDSCSEPSQHQRRSPLEVEVRWVRFDLL